MKQHQAQTSEELATKLAIHVANDLGIVNNQVRIELVKLFKEYVTLIYGEFNQYARDNLEGSKHNA